MYAPDLERTPWFPRFVNPHRPGVYECDWGCGNFEFYKEEIWYNRWDGEQWQYGNYSPCRRCNIWEPLPISDKGMRRWRGLVNPFPEGSTYDSNDLTVAAVLATGDTFQCREDARC